MKHLISFIVIAFYFSNLSESFSREKNLICKEAYEYFAKGLFMKTPELLHELANEGRWSEILLPNPWQGGIFPNTNLKKHTYMNNTILLGMYSPGVFKDIDEAINYLKKEIDISPKLERFPETIDTYEVARKYYAYNSSYKEQFDTFKKLTSIGCAVYLSSPASCGKILNRIMDLMHPIGDTNLHLINAEVMAEEAYRIPLKNLAIKIHNQIIRNDLSPSSFIFDDLLNEFYLSGVDADLALDYAFKVMGSISNNGANSPNYMTQFVSRENYEVITSITIISAGIYVLDSMKLKKYGTHYAYPQEFVSSCEYGKNYHFWMSAFLAHYFKQKGISKSSSEVAAYLSNLGYQVHSPTVGRNPSLALAYKDDDVSFNLARIDLIFSRLGAYFGNNYNKIKSKNIDLIINEVFERRKKHEPLTIEESRRMYKENKMQFQLTWEQIVRAKMINQI